MRNRKERSGDGPQVSLKLLKVHAIGSLCSRIILSGLMFRLSDLMGQQLCLQDPLQRELPCAHGSCWQGLCSWGAWPSGPCLAYCNQPDGFPFETEEGALVISKLPLASFFPCLKDTVNVHNQRVLWFGPIGSKLTGFLTFILISLPFLVQTGSVFADHLFSIPAYCGNDWFKWCFTLMLISL